jgi:hypothetical protein
VFCFTHNLHKASFVRSFIKQNHPDGTVGVVCFGFAERGGFEPPVPFWGTLAFQAGQLNHSCISPFVLRIRLLAEKEENKSSVLLKTAAQITKIFLQ